jgi:hypothetical protein
LLLGLQTITILGLVYLTEVSIMLAYSLNITMPKQNLDELLELANHYPSPHNGQPIRLKLKTDTEIDVYFEKQRGLQATDISFMFSFVSIGVFMEHLNIACSALGHGLTYKLSLPNETELKGEGLVKVAECSIKWSQKKPDEKLLADIKFRQTSRKKYSSGINNQLMDKLTSIANQSGMTLHMLAKEESHQAIWLNQRAVFDDLFDEPVRRELNHWLRYSQAEKLNKQDGLAYDCMELSGPTMKYIINHPKILKFPGVGQMLKKYYLRTMSDNSDVLYMLAPFDTEKASFEVGRAIMKIWMEITSNRLYLHPFGTIMSNRVAHRDFLKLANIDDESRKNYLVFIFRCGQSERPVASLRLPVKDHLVMEA